MTQDNLIEAAARIIDAELDIQELIVADPISLRRIKAERIARKLLPLLQGESRKQFPILGARGAKVDWALVADHSEQAMKNHCQSIERLAERGGLSWDELYAVLHNQKWQRMDINDAIVAVRALEARYLAALDTSAPPTADKEER